MQFYYFKCSFTDKNFLLKQIRISYNKIEYLTRKVENFSIIVMHNVDDNSEVDLKLNIINYSNSY